LTLGAEDPRILEVVQVSVTNPITGANKVVRAVMDSGSEMTMVSQSLADFLGLKIQQSQSRVPIQQIADKTAPLKKQTKFVLGHKTKREYDVPIDALVMDGSSWEVRLNAALPSWLTKDKDQLADPEFATSNGNWLPFDILLDVADSVLPFVNTPYKHGKFLVKDTWYGFCLLYTSPSPRDRQKSRMPSSA